MNTNGIKSVIAIEDWSIRKHDKEKFERYLDFTLSETKRDFMKEREKYLAENGIKESELDAE